MSVSSVRSQLRNQLRESVSVAILEAAEDLIAAKGLQGAPLAQIAKRAGVAVGTLYNYFEDRDALIRALFEMRRQTLRPQIKAAIAKHADLAFEPRLRAFLHEVFEVFEAHRKFIKVLFEAEHLKKSPATTPQDLALAISALVEAGVSEGVLDDKHAELLPTVIGGALRGILVRRIDENRKLSPDDTDALVSIVLDGTRK